MFSGLDDPNQTMESILSYIIQGRGSFGILDDWGDFLREVKSCGKLELMAIKKLRFKAGVNFYVLLIKQSIIMTCLAI